MSVRRVSSPRLPEVLVESVGFSCRLWKSHSVAQRQNSSVLHSQLLKVLILIKYAVVPFNSRVTEYCDAFS